MIQEIARRVAPLILAVTPGGDLACGNRCCRQRESHWRRLRHSGLRANGEWFCSPACLEQRIARDCAGGATSRGTQHSMPLGMILLARHVIDESSLRGALIAQRQTGERVGECLVREGLVSVQQVTAALAAQWQCPGIYGLQQLSADAAAIPLSILRGCRMVPIASATSAGLLPLMFDGPVDQAALYTVELMLDRRTMPCIGSAALTDGLLSEAESQTRDVEVNFGHAPAEMIARTTRSYVEELGADEIRYVSFGGRFWMRIRRQRATVHLVFSNKSPARKMV